jgi:hypothetical protein
MRLPAFLALAAVITFGQPWGKAAAHEFWIAPDRYQVEAGEPLVASLRVGQNFNGTSFPYLPQNFARFELVSGGEPAQVEGRLGDLPALQAEAADDGLVVIVHQTTPLDLKWTDWSKFTGFCEHKDFRWAIDDHRSRGLPETGFHESYTRFAKSLVAVGDGAGADRPAGMETEFVALANPYTDDLSAGMPVQLLYQGKPRMNVQVEVFSRAPDGTVEDLFYRTDTEGKATIPVVAGHEYLFDAVVMRPLPGTFAEGTAVWESLWASLTFRMPE